MCLRAHLAVGAVHGALGLRVRAPRAQLTRRGRVAVVVVMPHAARRAELRTLRGVRA